jgi:hypothetical protein
MGNYICFGAGWPTNRCRNAAPDIRLLIQGRRPTMKDEAAAA